MRPRSRIVIGLFVVVSSAAGCARQPTPGLQAPERLTLYSIDGRDFPPGKEPPGDQKFHRYPILGKVELTDPQQRQEVAGALQAGISRGSAHHADGFRPRHGLRAVENGKTVDYLICFDVDQLIAYIDGTPQRCAVTKGPQEVFDRRLKEAGVPLAAESVPQ